MFGDQLIPFENLGLKANADDTTYNFNYALTVRDIYDEANGKYGSEWGNAAFIDCNFVYNSVISFMKDELEEDWFQDKASYDTAIVALKAVDKFITERGITMCGIAMEIDGKLNDEAQYYMGSYKDILKNMSNKGNEIMEKLS